ncbi:hypothetical protein ABKA04_006020 [Annulohypoxylon sp. FPYF3050]
MLAAASAYLSSRGQRDTLTAHFEYPNRTTAGPAIVVIEDVKLTGQISTLHLTLWQGELLSQAPWVTPSERSPDAGRPGHNPPREEGAQAQAQAKEAREKDKQRASLWFPTVVMNIEAKTALPEEGVEWLAVRVTSKQIKEGKFDLDVMVRDGEGDIVTLSHHVAMIVSIERNMGKKGTSAKPVM